MGETQATLTKTHRARSRRHSRRDLRLHSRACSFALFILFVAPPLWAHGEQLIVVFGVALYGLPAAGLLLLPWHRWWARWLSVAVLVAGAVLLWSKILPGLDAAKMSALVEWSILLGPTICALVVAVMLRFLAKRGARSSV